MKYSTVIFDWAGTTVDFGCMAPVKAFERAFADSGIKLTYTQIRKPMGMLKIDHIRTLLDMPEVAAEWEKQYGRKAEHRDVQHLYAQFETYLFADLANNSQLKPETLTVFHTLKEKGYNIGSTTGYTKEMLDIVATEAKKAGYAPDFSVTPEDAGNFGRPYPYMIFENMKHFHCLRTDEVIKVGDTISDIQEGINAGVYTVGVIEGSSEMGLSLAEYQALSETKRIKLVKEVADSFYSAGADQCVLNLNELVDLLDGVIEGV
ncbi:phosphonoacetaldehyde hydrolase [Enterococcus sp. DIV0876]|uniref:phosphonoacetaldehyde hydrolase n=1 Tax=Enterococcus sp. DIV0876 TaxID=2774633 RepID=UPI003D30029F